MSAKCMKIQGLSLLICQTKGRFNEIRLPGFPSTGGPLPFPLAELVLRGSGLVPDFRVLQCNVAANLSFALSFYHCISKKSHFRRNTKFFSPSSLPLPRFASETFEPLVAQGRALDRVGCAVAFSIKPRDPRVASPRVITF
jgi:hypothetical protein